MSTTVPINGDSRFTSVPGAPQTEPGAPQTVPGAPQTVPGATTRPPIGQGLRQRLSSLTHVIEQRLQQGLLRLEQKIDRSNNSNSHVQRGCGCCTSCRCP